jgi:hypothetical protein
MEAWVGMKWFRTHIRTGSRLALLALAIQMVLSFGHFHADIAQAASVDSTIESVQLPAGPHHAPHPHPADSCAICAVMAQASAVLLATPPVLQLPQAAEFLYRVTRAEFFHLDAFNVAFQPRAPPLS